MHKIAISKANTDRLQMRLGKLHPFDVIDPRKTALVVVDMQNYFVKQGHQSEVPAAREIVPNINRLAAELRRRGGHVFWVRNGTNDTRESWSNYHNYLQSRDRAERRLKSMDIGEDGYKAVMPVVGHVIDYKKNHSTTWSANMKSNPKGVTENDVTVKQLIELAQ